MNIENALTHIGRLRAYLNEKGWRHNLIRAQLEDKLKGTPTTLEMFDRLPDEKKEKLLKPLEQKLDDFIGSLERLTIWFETLQQKAK